MYFEETRAFVTLSTHAPKEGKVQLHARVWLSCQHCRNIAEVVGSFIDLELEQGRLAQVAHQPVTDFPSGILSQFVHRQMGVFKANRDCDECGTNSGLPKSDTVKLEKALARLITAEWLNQKINGLILVKSHRDRLDRLRLKRVRRAGEAALASLATQAENSQPAKKDQTDASGAPPPILDTADLHPPGWPIGTADDQGSIEPHGHPFKRFRDRFREAVTVLRRPLDEA